MKKYGLVGEKLRYSYSKLIHDYLIDKLNLDASYDLIELDDILNIEITSYDGLNFTTPFKEDVLSRVLERTDSVNVIKAANVCSDQKLYNTDINGFIDLFSHLNLKIDEINRVVILGNSKTARTISYVLSDKEVLICSRTQKPGVITYDQEDLLYGDLVINTTILGRGDYASLSPIDESLMKNFKYAIDVNYNPMRNQFLMDASRHGLENINGLRMLIVQAIRSFEIWHDIIVDKNLYDELYHYIVQQVTCGTVFVGMPYSGKSHLKKLFSDKGLSAVDIDELFTEKYSLTPADFIIKNGESEFRKIETQLFNNCVEDGYKYIFTGGGIVKDLNNISLLCNHDVILIDTPLESLLERFNRLKDKRALINEEEDLIKLYNERRKKYEIFANRKLSYDEIINLKWS